MSHLVPIENQNYYQNPIIQLSIKKIEPIENRIHRIHPKVQFPASICVFDDLPGIHDFIIYVKNCCTFSHPYFHFFSTGFCAKNDETRQTAL